MALTDENGMGTTMLVQPSGFGGNGGFGFGDGNGWWIILLFILLGGWGNGFGGGFGGNGDLYPWMNQSNQINGGFRDQMIFDNVTGIRDGIQGISTQLCNGFNGVAQQLSANQMADLERSFAAQTASTAGMTAIQSQLASCCCDNRLATNDLKYTIATEACADRAALSDGVQKIMDKLCALELDGVKGQLAQAQRENVGLQNQLNMATLRESQIAQNAFIQQGFSNEVDALYNRLSNCPVPSTPVYGRTPIFTCNNGGCGCGAAM